jgi:hypothetical protein
VACSVEDPNSIRHKVCPLESVTETAAERDAGTMLSGCGAAYHRISAPASSVPSDQLARRVEVRCVPACAPGLRSRSCYCSPPPYDFAVRLGATHE